MRQYKPSNSETDNIPTISFRAPLRALLAFLRLPCNFLLPKYRTQVVLAKAMIAADQARFRSIHDCTRSANDCDPEDATFGGFLTGGRMEEGIHVC